MKEKKNLLRKAVVAVIVLVILIPCSVLVYETSQTKDESTIQLYYMMNDGKMKPVGRNVTFTENALEETLAMLRDGPKMDGASASIPEDVEFLSAEMDGKTAIVNVSRGYYRLENVREVVCRSSIVWTLTSLEGVEDVKILVDGQPLHKKSGEEYGLMNRQNILIDSVIFAEPTEYAILKLYFANQDGTDLVVEERVVEVNTNQAREKTILEQLIAGPLEEGCYATIPAETKIRDVTITNDGTCYVDLSQEFVAKHNSGAASELVMVYSIVNSLCELETVEKVQFLINGEKLKDYDGHLDFVTPFTAVNSLRF
ncbi:MAG: GerMN domain-containing protein [Anaerotignum sp.]|nr:GerMN domain-containing protein [Anaerotignum sp.]MCI8868193.1 GerMN domain-containing protein [Anaerotignum sp.]